MNDYKSSLSSAVHASYSLQCYLYCFSLCSCIHHINLLEHGILLQAGPWVEFMKYKKDKYIDWMEDVLIVNKDKQVDYS